MIQRQTSLSGNVVAFCRYLREHEFRIGPNDAQQALEAVQLTAPFDSPSHLQLCLQAILCRSPKQLQQFPLLYQNYWQELDRAVDSKIKEVEEGKKQPVKSQQKAPSIQELKSWLYGNRNEDITETATYSAMEAFSQQDFSGFSEEELREVYKVVKMIAQLLSNQKNKRFTKSRKPQTLDLRNTMRQSLKRGGTLLELSYKARKKQDIRIVLICDVSRSMELYSRFLIQFMYGFQRHYSKIDTFVFSTSLHSISNELQEQSLETALQNLSERVPDWSGGTKIGHSLEQFNQKYAHKMLSGKSIVLVLSDGWDTGEIDLLRQQMRFLHRRASKVIWLNPLAGRPNWTAEVQGMKTALPYVDVFLPAHNVESLRQVVKHLGKRKHSSIK